MNKKEFIACRTCGFPKNIVREPIFIKSDIFSLSEAIDDEQYRCKECGHYKYGTTIPIVQKKIRDLLNKRSKAKDAEFTKKIESLIEDIEWEDDENSQKYIDMVHKRFPPPKEAQNHDKD